MKETFGLCLSEVIFQLRPFTLKPHLKIPHLAGHPWLMPVILAMQEAEIRRITVGSQPRQVVCETLFRKTLHKNRAGRVAQSEGLEFKPQYCKKKEKTKFYIV
jgi:hypothetical protein